MNDLCDTSARSHPITKPQDAALPVPVAPPGIEDVLRAIRADCRVAPQEYLDEVHVPCGGE